MGKEQIIAEASMLDSLLLEKDIKRDLQVIMQILIEKNITTREEITTMRNIVETNSPTIISLTKKINELQSNVDENTEMLEMFVKMKDGTATDEERRVWADKIKENPTKYGSLIRDLMR